MRLPFKINQRFVHLREAKDINPQSIRRVISALVAQNDSLQLTIGVDKESDISEQVQKIITEMGKEVQGIAGRYVNESYYVTIVNHINIANTSENFVMFDMRNYPIDSKYEELIMTTLKKFPKFKIIIVYWA